MDGFNSVRDCTGEDKHDWLVVSKLGDMHEKLPCFDAHCVDFIKRMVLHADGDRFCTQYAMDFAWNVGAFYKLMEEISSNLHDRSFCVSIFFPPHSTAAASAFFVSPGSGCTVCMSLRCMSRSPTPR